MRPTRKLLLQMLDQAGDKGVLVTEFIECTDDPLLRQRRNNLINAILGRLEVNSLAERMGKEKSPVYRQVPAWRWRITDAGRDLLASAPVKTRRELKAEALRRKEQDKDCIEAQLRGQQIPKEERGEVAVIMADGGFTLEEIGEFFRVTRERARQLIVTERIGAEDWDHLPQAPWVQAMISLREKGYGPWNPDEEILHAARILKEAGCPDDAAAAFVGLHVYQLRKLLMEAGLDTSPPGGYSGGTPGGFI